MTKVDFAPRLEEPDDLGTTIDGVGGAIVRVVDLESHGKEKTMQAIDMRGQTVDEVKIRLAEMAGDDLVMRGSNGAIELIEEFDPARSNLAGKKQSVYATDDPETALFNALLNKHGSRAVALRMLDGAQGASSRMVIHSSEKKKFVIPENMARAIQEAYVAGPGSSEWSSLFGDGVVYLMPKDKFSQESPLLDGSPEETDHEWNTQQKVASEFAVTVSPELIMDVLRFDGEDANVEIIPVNETEVLEGFKHDMNSTIPEGKKEFSTDELMAIAQGSEERLAFAEALRQRIGSGALPREQFVELATKLYEERVRKQANIH